MEKIRSKMLIGLGVMIMIATTGSIVLFCDNSTNPKPKPPQPQPNQDKNKLNSKDTFISSLRRIHGNI